MEVLRALGALADGPTAATGAIAAALGLPTPTAADHHATFDAQLPPYASIYLGAEGMIGGDARDRVAGFLRALGASPPAEPDHLATLLGAAAALVERSGTAADEQHDAWRDSADALVHEHLRPWLVPYLDRVQALDGPYGPWAALLAEVLDGLGPHPEPGLPVHLRQAPPALGPAVEASDVVASILVPARSGIILTRADLLRMAEQLGLGVRVGERRFVLAALLGQSPGPVLDRLAAAAAAQADDHRRHIGRLPEIAGWWAGRADATAARLGALASDAAAVVTALEHGS